MGGFGSGRLGFRRIAEHVQRVDVREWHRRKYLDSFMSFTWRWHRGDEQAGSIGVTAPGDHVRLSYRIGYDDEWPGVSETIYLTRTPCSYGGSRPWFRCPRRNRRVAVLYTAGGRFICRLCGRVGYAVENEDRVQRAWRRHHKACAKLPEDGEKPKWMRWRTYERICTDIEEADQRIDEAWLPGALRLFQRLGVPLPE